MAGTIQVHGSTQLQAQNQAKKFHAYRLKRPWSYGRGYMVIAGVALVVLVSLAIVYVHQIWHGRLQQISK